MSPWNKGPSKKLIQPTIHDLYISQPGHKAQSAFQDLSEIQLKKKKKRKQTLILLCVCTISICNGKVIQKQTHVSVTFRVLLRERRAKVNSKSFSPKFRPFKCPDPTSFKTGVSKLQFQRTFFLKAKFPLSKNCDKVLVSLLYPMQVTAKQDWLGTKAEKVTANC